MHLVNHYEIKVRVSNNTVLLYSSIKVIHLQKCCFGWYCNFYLYIQHMTSIFIFSSFANLFSLFRANTPCHRLSRPSLTAPDAHAFLLFSLLNCFSNSAFDIENNFLCRIIFRALSGCLQQRTARPECPSGPLISACVHLYHVFLVCK